MSRQAQKAAATRRRLLDATYDCLVAHGYHGTTTVKVCAMAGLSRGTMLHHFPSKQALVLAAIDDLLARRIEAFQARLVELDNPTPEVLLDQLWAILRGPTFVAWLELAVASRTDPVLAAEFRAVMARFDAVVRGLSPVLLPNRPDADVWISVAFSALNGMALDLLQSPPDVVEARVQAAKQLALWVLDAHVEDL